MDINNIEIWHPKLIGKNYKIININYNLIVFNCFAYSLDIFDEWCGASEKSWPYNILSRSPKLDNYIKYYNLFGYNVCNNDKYESDYEKIALYIDNSNCVNHASKQNENMWRSKLGKYVIIEHELEWLTGFDAENYGNIGVILKRNRKA